MAADNGGRQSKQLQFAMVCASNMNRSMEAHAALKDHDMNVYSYGIGSSVKLPGASIKEPNVYTFGTPYSQIYDDLKKKDPDLYTRNGILPMLARNAAVKRAPQRWQDSGADGFFDVVFAFEERVFELVVDNLAGRRPSGHRASLVLNLDVRDKQDEAAVAAQLCLQICQRLQGVAEDWEEHVDDIATEFEREAGRRLLYMVAFQ
eukprot:jgi/Mesvir1/17802/Mv12906-RA.1